MEPSESQLLVSALKTKVADQEEQIQTLIKKRRDDLEKLKEFERTKLQLDQVSRTRTTQPVEPSITPSFLAVTHLQARSTGAHERHER